jgi:hypothetical protein
LRRAGQPGKVARGFGNGREDGKMTTSNWIDGLNHRENETVSECLELHDLTPAQEQEVRSAIQRRWNETSGRFYAYTVAHEIAAAYCMKNVPSADSSDLMETPDTPPLPGSSR